VDERQENTILTEDVQQLEATLRDLWEQTRNAADMIRSLRGHNRELLKSVDELEGKVGELLSKLTQREDEIKIMQHQLQEIRSNGLSLMDQGEKAELRNQIVSLLDKINSHL
jgi:uncharacterized protein (DUF3084 family)